MRKCLLWALNIDVEGFTFAIVQSTQTPKGTLCIGNRHQRMWQNVGIWRPGGENRLSLLATSKMQTQCSKTVVHKPTGGIQMATSIIYTACGRHWGVADGVGAEQVKVCAAPDQSGVNVLCCSGSTFPAADSTLMIAATCSLSSETRLQRSVLSSLKKSNWNLLTLWATFVLQWARSWCLLLDRKPQTINSQPFLESVIRNVELPLKFQHELYPSTRVSLWPLHGCVFMLVFMSVCIFCCNLR